MKDNYLISCVVRNVYLSYRASIWSICVLVPLMGISWVFGIFYIDEDLFWIQYVFAICNGLQASFLFHQCSIS